MGFDRRAQFRKGLFAVIFLMMFLALICFIELYVRMQPISPAFARFLFFTEFKAYRWEYLSNNTEIHQLDVIMESFPNINYTEQPEANRPPFDQVPTPFEVQHNSLGFRDKEFIVDPDKRQIMVLGDSIAFGKGVTQKNRFSSILEANLPQAQVFNLGLQGCTAECMARLWSKHHKLLQPEVLLIQASGNDLDQVLWKEAMERRLPGLSLSALAIIKKSWLAQWILFKRGSDRIQEQMAAAQLAVLEKQREFISQMYVSANQNNVQIWVLNLPYAYDYYYGDHMTTLCTEQLCQPQIKIDFDRADRETIVVQDGPDFVTKTADQMPLTESQLDLVFPHRKNFHDVVHLNTQGHAVVAEQILEAFQAVKD